MKIAKYFTIQEYVPPHIYHARGEKAWELIDPRLIETNDALRDKFGPMIINTWHSEKLQKAYGFREWSGLRTAEFYRKDDLKLSSIENTLNMYRSHEKSLSQHKYGRASDALFKNHSALAVREYVMLHPEEFPYLTAIEEGVRWFHGDVRNCKLKLFYP